LLHLKKKKFKSKPGEAVQEIEARRVSPAVQEIEARREKEIEERELNRLFPLNFLLMTLLLKEKLFKKNESSKTRTFRS
jgi:hypothetical protein